MTKKTEELKKDTDQILQGIRIVLPGTQALMGFQFVAFFNPVFQNLPEHLKELHFVTLLMTIICSILLIAPVSYQQIGEGGSPTARFLRYTRKMLGTAMIFLLLAFTGDVYVAARTIGDNNAFAIIITLLIFGLGFFFWYIYTFMRRQDNGGRIRSK